MRWSNRHTAFQVTCHTELKTLKTVKSLNSKKYKTFHFKFLIKVENHLELFFWPFGVYLDAGKKTDESGLTLHVQPKTLGASYVLYGAAGLDVVAEGHPLLVVGVLPGAEDVLETLEVGSLIDHPRAALHPDGVAAAEVCVQVGAVAAAVVAAALEFLLLKKCDLWQN